MTEKELKKRLTDEEILSRFKELPLGSIVFVYGKGFISKGIRIFQKFESMREMKDILKNYKEINLSFDHPTHCECKYSHNSCISAEVAGVTQVPFSRLLKKEVGIAFGIPELRTQEDRDWQKKAEWFLRKSIGKMYDYSGFIGFLWRVPLLGQLLTKIFKGTITHWKFAQFCSELVANAYSLGNHIILKEDTSKISPLELEKACRASEKMKYEIVRQA